ncbi:MAG: SDR family oxidoreductase [Pseudomonadota bacterium]
MKILVTGSEGYIGCVLTPRLIAAGFDVVGFDTGYYRDGWLFSEPAQLSVLPPTIIGDLRDFQARHLEGIDAVVHLAELSNDPLGENSPAVTFDINHRGSVKLAEMAKAAGIERFVYTSSCSVYGVSGKDIVDETSPVDPQTAYAKCKCLVENDLTALADDSFSPVFLRNATAFGASPRMRFDIVLNNLAGLAWVNREIAMTSDGSPWRPLVHIDDISSAVIAALQAPRDLIHGEVFNVGANAQNYQVREIAEAVAHVFPGCKVSFGPADQDNRSYKVNFDKIAALPGYDAKHALSDGAQELYDVFSRIEMAASTFEFRAFTRLKQLKYLLRTQQIDDAFYWRR